MDRLVAEVPLAVRPADLRRVIALAEINAAVAECVQVIDERPFGKMEGYRRSLFEEIDRSAMRPLPAQALPPTFPRRRAALLA